MKELLSKKFWIVMLVIAALVGSVVAVEAIDKKSDKPTEPSAVATDSGGTTTEQVARSLYSRGRWLSDLMILSGKADRQENPTAQSIVEQAKSCGILSRYDDEDLSQPLDRRFVARTMVKAMGYKNRSVGYLADVSSLDSDLATMAYYGYFLPDVNFMMHPDALVTSTEYEALLKELDRFRQLRGKTILSFGDSIMYGAGNGGEGIADMLAEKYGMTAADYAVSGAAIGIREGRGHIRDQLKSAISDKVQPDVILLNGGTNDMNWLELGEIGTGFDMSQREEEDFTGGLEKTFWSIKNTWKNVPVIFIRAHNMDWGDDLKERLFGQQALQVAAKWGVRSVDLYSVLNTEDTDTAARYTFINADTENLADSIHPNAVGYAKFYLPAVAEKLINETETRSKL